MDLSSTEQDEALAEALVTEALVGYKNLLSAEQYEDLHEFLVEELLCTKTGRMTLYRAGAVAPTNKSDDVYRPTGESVSEYLDQQIAKKRGGAA